MAEIKNTFLQSKMNKDLDDRIIPNGQYRDALNVSIGKSEQDDIGSLQPILGNYNLPIPADDETLVCIGFFMDNQNNRIYRFLTDYIDPQPAQINYPGEDSIMKISVYDVDAQTYTTLVNGSFLNFSYDNGSRINGVNLIEGLLYWTDNRNQPRKINVNTALANPNYYTTEEHISVAKYAPVEPISLVRKIIATVDTVLDPYEIQLEDATGILPGMTVVSTSVNICDYMIVVSVDGNVVTLYEETSAISNGDVLTFLGSTMSDKAEELNWPGDPDFLEDKYVRFSYRFRFDDNEYSLMAPFTQIAYIPKQKGYFINGDETAAYRSTIVRWMENNVNNIELLIPFPDLLSNVNNSYKIIEADVLYKESDSNAVKVLETIPYSTWQSTVDADQTNVYNQPYQSQKPYKTLAEDETVRVYDLVPTRARAQEISGNRVMYGNYYSMYTAPSSINYNVTINPKTKFFTSFVEYPNHTLKQNRNYQVGFVLSDKYGRQSPVILSTIDLLSVTGSIASSYFGGSTIYAPYIDSDAGYPDVICWPGNALLVLVNSVISSTRNIPNGTPGLYATPITKSNTPGFSIISSDIFYNSDPLVNAWQYTYYEDTTPGINSLILTEGNWLRGQYVDYVEVLAVDPLLGSGYTITTSGRVNDLYSYNSANEPDTKFAYYINTIGWYSYKIVVRQQEQDYYNAYLPGMLNAYPVDQTYGSQVTYTVPGGVPSLDNGINKSDFPLNEIDKTAHIVLINDNINKIPRDLAEVGPDQKQYRSSVQLFGRVENTSDPISFNAIIPAPVINATSFEYDMTVYTNLANEIEVGDILFYDGAPPWYANTSITKIELDVPSPGTGTITFSPAQDITNADLAVTVLKGANRQYYPTRKADVVTSIANSIDFDFLQNSVENIAGSTGRNIYQLQTNPLIGRISTINGIGTTGGSMVPFLSVYETSPEESLLDLFWETTTAGLISDLNWDVLVGTSVPVDLNPFDSLFYESQNKNGGGDETGADDSAYITDDIFPLDSSGIAVIPSAAELISVFDNSEIPVDSTSRFEIRPGINPNTYRIAINDNFVFDNSSLTTGQFSFNIRFEYDNIWYYFSFNIQLANKAPILPLCPTDGYNRVIDNTATVIETITAYNGAFGNSTIGLLWEIVSGNSDGYFSINSSNGELSLANQEAALGAYTLRIRVTDATNNGLQLIGSAPFGSLSTDCDIIISLQNVPLTPCLNNFSSSKFIYQNAYRTIPDFYSYRPEPRTRLPFPAGYGGIYVGTANSTLDSNGFNSNLPFTPNNNGRFQSVINVATANGCTTPTALTQGSLRWIINLNGFINAGANCGSATNKYQLAKAYFLLYYRPNATSAWTLATTDNRYDFNAQANDWTIANSEPRYGYNYPGGNIWQQQSGCGRIWNNQWANLLTGNQVTQNPFGVHKFDLPGPNVIAPNVNQNSGVEQFDTYNGYPDAYSGLGMFSYYTGVTPNTKKYITSLTKAYEPSWNSGGNGTYSVEGRMNMGLQAGTWRNRVVFQSDTDKYSTEGGLCIRLDPGQDDWVVGSTAKRSTSFVTSTPGEYFLAIRLVDGSSTECRIDGIGPWVDVELEDANFTYVGPTPVRTAYRYNVRILNPGDDYPSAVPSDSPDARYTYDFNVACKTSDDSAIGDPIQLTNQSFTDFAPRIIIEGMACSEPTNTYFSPGTKVNSVDYVNKRITITPDSLLPIPNNFEFSLVHNSLDSDGILWSDTNDGTEVKQLYVDEDLTEFWIPPIADKYYTFQNMDRNYSSGDAGLDSSMPGITNKPNFCAKFNATGGVIPSISTLNNGVDLNDPTELWSYGRLGHKSPTIQTAWYNSPSQDLRNNYHHNISQVITTP
jgi:hypothetical protein